jgi:uncharacterized membrane protein
MQTWLVYGLIAALLWGGYIVVAKVATSEKYFGINSSYVSLLMLIGIAVVFIANTIYEGKFELPQNTGGMAIGILAGALWALGMVVSLKAIAAGADVAKLTPIYNTNTLVAVILGIIILNELPSADNMLRVLAGAVLIVIGAILVSV